MILLVNVFLTEEVLNNDTLRYNRGFLDHPYQAPKYDKVDIFKYTLASYSVIPCTKVLIYCKLDTMYEHREAELREFIEEEFADQNVKLEFRRNEYQKDWQDVYNTEIDGVDDIIWFCCNHDHVFMDYDLEVLEEGLKELKKHNSPAAIYPSHWPELLHKASHVHNENPGPCDVYDKYIGFQLLNNNDSIQIINSALYKRWWFEENYGNAYLPRSDYRLADSDGNPIGYDIRNGRNRMLQHYCLVPLRELCRHYDGYGHVEINPNKCPALSIPPGFFENDIKIRYGFDKYDPEWVNVSPAKQYYRVVDKHGADYKWVTSDIPLFWQKRLNKDSIPPEKNGGCIDLVATWQVDWDSADRNQAIETTAECRMELDGRELKHNSWYSNFQTVNKKR